jgi:probable HAF family extracellular repeat protein
MTRRTHRIRLGVAAAGALAGAPACGQHYTITDLGSLGGQCRPTDINNAGQVVGAAVGPIAGGSPFRAFRYDGVLHEILPLAGALDSHAFAIDESGRVFGTSFTVGRLAMAGFVAGPDGIPVSLGAFAARDANTLGDVAGWRSVTADDGFLINQACLLRGGVLSDLPGIGGMNSLAMAVSDMGDVVGSASLPGEQVTHAVLWRAGQVHDLGTLGGTRSQALGANAAGQIVGISTTTGGEVHAMLVRTGPSGDVLSRTDLGTLGDHASTPSAINLDGLVVGTSNNRAFLWDGTALIDLNSRISDPGWTLQAATAINDHGLIAGWGIHSGYPAAFLLRPFCAPDLSGSSDPNDPTYGTPDGRLDASDFFYYLDQFVLGNLAESDLTGSSDPADPTYGVPDGDADAEDFFYYLDLFVAGCP